uniref:Uncharacterized protein n=1 Tax=Ciona intestinalis TaxID=7719 RepID=F6YN02_CIOIN
MNSMVWNAVRQTRNILNQNNQSLSTGQHFFAKKENVLKFKHSVERDHLLYKAKQISDWLSKERNVKVMFYGYKDQQKLEDVSNFLKDKVSENCNFEMTETKQPKGLNLYFTPSMSKDT